MKCGVSSQGRLGGGPFNLWPRGRFSGAVLHYLDSRADCFPLIIGCSEFLNSKEAPLHGESGESFIDIVPMCILNLCAVT